jgi:glutaredoxin
MQSQQAQWSELMSNVVLYSATNCPLCEKYRVLLANKGVAYIERNTTEKPELLDELVAQGIRMVPTVFVGDKIVAGFRPNSLMELLAS